MAVRQLSISGGKKEVFCTLLHFRREVNSGWIYEIIRSERVWLIVLSWKVSAFSVQRSWHLDFTRYPVCLVCISEMGPEQTESITFTTNKIEKKWPILIYMIPTNQQSRNITARWYTLNAACASFLKLGGWMIIVFWNFPICSIYFETCTCGHFNQVVFAVYSYRDTGSRFFFL